MGLYNINTNFLEIISGTNNTVSRVYREAADNVDKANDKGLTYLKNFITSIENIANKKATKDPRISKTRGNIKALDCYDNIEFAINFIKKNLANAPGFKDILTLHDKCVEFHPIYADGYDKHCRLVMLEYESVVDLLITGLAMTFSNNMEVVQNGDRIKIQKTNESTHGVYEKTIKEWATQLSKNTHKKYLEELNKAMDQVKPDTSLKESVLMESEVSNAVDAINVILDSIRKLGAIGVSAVKTVKNSIFGIVPLIRASMYLKYKKKADAINALDEQCVFIKRNIEQLQNIKTMDEEKKAEIIKKQEAVIEQYQKKAAKLRAQLMETEKDAATAIEKEDPELKKTDEDFVLEGVSISEMFVDELFEEAADMKIYDKASWHLDKNADKNEIIAKFTKVFEFLHKNSLLNKDGEELYNIGIDSSISLHSKLVTDDGKNFLDKYYDSVIECNSKEIYKVLQTKYNEYNKNANSFTIFGVEFEIPEVSGWIDTSCKDKLDDETKSKARQKFIDCVSDKKNIKKIEDAIFDEENEQSDESKSEINKRIKAYLEKSKSGSLLCTKNGKCALKIKIPHVKNVSSAWMEHEMWITSDAKVLSYDDVEFMK